MLQSRPLKLQLPGASRPTANAASDEAPDRAQSALVATVAQEDEVIRVLWTRTELIALREAIELTPNFKGRQETRAVFGTALRAPRIVALELDAELAETLVRRVVPLDPATASAHAKLLRAVQAPKRK